ncbi:MAG: toll/interleukin-1 receptor domain-containing protein [Xanthomonadales bacterium]|nr:toll/interleukin-1 receptor domain-containing protein [Xanthomonadales bacterium]
MTEFRYKAFISYSHRDEKWATWLHKALESYRLPRGLVGSSTRHGTVPRRLYPVFRDRDELSSGASLSERVQAALTESESLVVICSPSAAQSRWVNEEIRAFRALGRGDRIFCMIVDGDPQAKRLEDSAFPPALLETGVGETVEPLAADSRKWADGKSLAFLKLVSGIIGLRLDALRQREQVRQRRRRLINGALGVIAAALIAIALVSRVQESARRAHAETLVGQIVEISDELEASVDLETLRSLGVRLQNYLDTIAPGDLTPESRKQVALVLRQLGNIEKNQGKLEGAFQALSQSRAIFNDLADSHPDNTDYRYELGNAEFFVATVHMEQLQFGLARQALLNYQRSAEWLMSAEPDNPNWIMEVSYSYTNLAALAERSGDTEQGVSLEYMQEAIRHIERAMELRPDSQQYQSEYGTTLSWLADAQMRVCDISGALESRRKGESLARTFSGQQPGNLELKKELAFALTGLAMVQRKAGHTSHSLQSLIESRQILEELSRRDQSNFIYQWELLRRDGLIADLRLDIGEGDSAFADLRATKLEMESVLLDGHDIPRKRSQFAQVLLDFGEAARRTGRDAEARDALDEALDHLQSVLEENPSDKMSLERLGQASILWREIDPTQVNPLIQRFEQEVAFIGPEPYSCTDANLAFERAILEGDRQAATTFGKYLIEKNYSDPEFLAHVDSVGLFEDP